MQTPVLGFKGVFIARTRFPDELLDENNKMRNVACSSGFQQRLVWFGDIRPSVALVY